jgi:spermidine synthase
LTLFVVTVAYVAAGLFLLVIVRHQQVLMAAFAVGALSIGLSALSAAQASPCTKESQYFCIRVLDVSSDPASPVKRMVLDHLSHGTSARDAPRIMFSEFTAMLDGIALGRMDGRQFSAFFIGGGSYSVPRAWADRGTGSIMVAEIDPEVTQTAIEEFWLDPTQIDIVDADARRALQSMKNEKFDVIIGDAFSDIAVPVHLVTKEFFQLVESRLNDKGVFLMNVIDFPNGLHALAAISRTLKTVFPTVEIWTKALTPEPHEQRTFVLVAARDATRFSSIVVPSPSRTKFAALHRSFFDDNLRALGDFLLTDDYAPIDHLLLKGSSGM